jgi:hypothetical protein
MSVRKLRVADTTLSGASALSHVQSSFPLEVWEEQVSAIY